MIELEIKNGQEIIDVLFDDFASCLIIKNPLSVNWPDCEGTVGEFYAISDYSTEDRDFYTNRLNETLIYGNEIERINCVKDFLQLFTNGKYEIRKDNILVNHFNFKDGPRRQYSLHGKPQERFFGWFYDDYRSFEPYFYSKTNSNLNNERIDFYVDLIKSGERPCVLTCALYDNSIEDSSRSFILDGHHKIEAYIKLKINIPIISILKYSNNLTKTEVLLDKVKPILKDYEFGHLSSNDFGNL